MRFSSCLIGDLCQERCKLSNEILFLFQLGVGAVYDHTEFRRAASKKELCSTTKYRPNIVNSTKTKGFKDFCLKSKSNNLFICPKDTENKDWDTPATRTFGQKKIVKFNNEIAKHKCCKVKKKMRYKIKGSRFDKHKRSKRRKTKSKRSTQKSRNKNRYKKGKEKLRSEIDHRSGRFS